MSRGRALLTLDCGRRRAFDLSGASCGLGAGRAARRTPGTERYLPSASGAVLPGRRRVPLGTNLRARPNQADRPHDTLQADHQCRWCLHVRPGGKHLPHRGISAHTIAPVGIAAKRRQRPVGERGFLIGDRVAARITDD